MNPAIQNASTTGSMGLISQLAKAIYRAASEEAIGVKLKQLIAMQHLRDNEHCLQQELASTLMLDPNNCVLLLNELDERGYVERVRDPEDRRRHIVRLTGAGEDALAAGERGLEDLEDEVLGRLDAEDRRTLHGLLVKAAGG